MNVLVTAGNTQAPIDKVRCLTNIFTGRTGAHIALEAQRRGHTVNLLTSHPETVEGAPSERWIVCRYRTFDDLQTLMETHIATGPPDAIVHCAAVSDYLSAGVYAPAPGTAFTYEGSWEGENPAMVDRRAAKVKSDEPELWIRLVRAPKLVDRIRSAWGFRGILVKFKLEVGLTDEQLLLVAERSRKHSDADLMVANTLEGASQYAFIGSEQYERVPRADLARRLMERLEASRAIRG